MRKAEKDYIVEGLYSELEAENLAKFKIDRQDNKIPSDLRAKLDVSNFILNPDIVIVDPKTGIGIFKTGIRDNKKDDYRPGRAYVAPADGKIYIYDGTKFVKAPGY
jgi:hypothetical protein